MRPQVLLFVVIAAVLSISAFAQQPVEQAAEKPPAEPDAELDELLEGLNVPPEQAPLVRMLLEGEEIDPTLLMLMLAAAERGGGGGGGGDEMLGMLFFSNAFRGAQQAAQPVALLAGENLFIIDKGVLYRVNVEKMTVEGSVVYKQTQKDRLKKTLAVIGPAIAGAGERARDATLRAHLTTLQNAADLYRNDVGAGPATLEELTLEEGPQGYNGPYIGEVPTPPIPGTYVLDPETGKVTFEAAE